LRVNLKSGEKKCPVTLMMGLLSTLMRRLMIACEFGVRIHC